MASADQPAQPRTIRETALISGFDSRLIYADDSHENYGGRMRGLFIPPVSGNWMFHMRSDDPGRLYFNPTGPSAAGKVQVGDQTGCWQRLPSVRRAAERGLSADWRPGVCRVAVARVWRRGLRPGGGGAASAPGPTATNLVGYLVGAGAAPAGIGGPLNITQQPADVSALANATVSFSVQANNPNGLPIAYQWTRDGADIAGATGPTLSVGPLTLGDDGAVFAVKLGVVGTSTVSQNARLSMAADTIKPTVVSVKATTD